MPGVRVPNLASHVLSLGTRRLAADWTKRYGFAPVPVETFVDPSRFDGSSYRAANWLGVGQTAARRTAYGNGKVATGPKDIFVYRLSRGWRSVLGYAPEEPLCSQPAVEAPTDWAEAEFGRFPAYDQRLRQRLVSLARDFAAQPGELVPQACHGSAAKTKAAYRFFANPQVNMRSVLRPHIEATIERLGSPSGALKARCHTSPGQRPGNRTVMGLSPVGASYLPYLRSEAAWSAPSGLNPRCGRVPRALPWAPEAPLWG